MFSWKNSEYTIFFSRHGMRTNSERMVPEEIPTDGFLEIPARGGSKAMEITCPSFIREGVDFIVQLRNRTISIQRSQFQLDLPCLLQSPFLATSRWNARQTFFRTHLSSFVKQFLAVCCIFYVLLAQKTTIGEIFFPPLGTNFVSIFFVTYGKNIAFFDWRSISVEVSFVI